MVYLLEVIFAMKKRTAIIGALVSLLPVGQPLVIGTGAVLTSTAVMVSVPAGVNAETWSCTYQFDGKTKKFLIYRQGDQFNNLDSGFYKIIDENGSKIHLYKTFFPDMKNYYAISLDNKKRMFSMVALNPGNDSAIISGPCNISYWKYRTQVYFDDI